MKMATIKNIDPKCGARFSAHIIEGVFMSFRSSCINFGLKLIVKPYLSKVEFNPLLRYISRTTVSEVCKLIPMPRSVKIIQSQIDGVPVEWLVDEKAKNSKNVVLYIHGGAFIALSPTTHRSITTRLSKLSGSKVLAVDYRKAPEFPFPAGLNDCKSTYIWLLNNGYNSANIIIAGDSAGGNLTLATMLSLRDDGLPMPVAAMCLSPWTDLTLSGKSMIYNAGNDVMIPVHRIPELVKMLSDYDTKHYLISPLFADLKYFPPLFIQVGESEVVFDDSQRLVELARSQNVEVDYKVWKNTVHVFPILAPYLPEANSAIKKMARFAARHFNEELATNKV